MRSVAGILSALALLLALPIAIAADMLVGGTAELAIHIVVGLGMVLLAVAAFDFDLPRPVTWIGAASAAAFGGIFLLQAMSQLFPSIDALHYVAYQVLGQQIEGVLPYVVLVWFGALLAIGSQGISRIVGAVTVSAVIGATAAMLIGPFVGIDFTLPKILFLLPFVWLLIESIKAHPAEATRPAVAQQQRIESPTA